MASSEHERRLARLRAERQRARLAAARRRKRRREALLAAAALLLAVAVVAVLLPRVLGGSTAAVESAGAPLPCAYIPDASTNPRVSTRPTPPGFGTRRSPTAVLQTDRGAIEISLLATDAPCATESFQFLAARRYFDGSVCDRLTTEGLHFLQCGTPLGGTGPGYTFSDENLAGARYPRGTVAMANRGPNSNGSRFFIVYGDTPLPPDFTPFGVVTKGLEVVDRVAAAGANPAGDGRPLLPVTLTSVRTAAG